MKKLKIFILLGIILLTSGCFKRDNLDGINIVTTTYPIEYVTNYLYKDHANVASIYPDAVDTTKYTLSKKQIEDYSKKKLFIYNGLDKDKDTAITFLDKNKNLLIIDSTYGMQYNYSPIEVWLNPSNLLMIAQNIKSGLQEYMTNSYLEKELDTKYEELKVLLSELDAEIKLTAENASRKTLIVNDDALKYLEKYGFEIISLDNRNETVSDRTITEVKNMIKDGDVKHIIMLEHTENNDIIKEIIEDTEVETYKFRKLDSITDAERDEGKDYINIMTENIDLLKNELY